ncbi:MAG: helix-turn-helix domain-containing protein [bacterium]|nr:helix-turn-helix domain-containing protein [bacterium]
MFVEKLRQFGLDEKEISVYLALIPLGPSPVRAISAKAGINRGTTYDILKSLIKQELVSYYHKYGQDSKKQYFVAEPPEKIVTAIEKKIGDLSALKLSVEKSLPELESLYEKSGAKPVVKYYEGSSGVRVILQDVIGTMSVEEKKQYYVYSSADIREYLYKAYPNFNRDRIKAKISNQVIAIGRGGELVGLDERKWLLASTSGPTYILIYGNKVAMISIAANADPVGVIIEDRALYQTQKMIFEHLWQNLK